MRPTHPAARLLLFTAMAMVTIFGGPTHLVGLTLLLASLAAIAARGRSDVAPPSLGRPWMLAALAASLALTVAINAYLVPGTPSSVLAGASQEGLAFGAMLAWRLGLLYVLMGVQMRLLPYRELFSVVSQIPRLGLPVGLAARFVPEVSAQGRRLAAARQARGLAHESRGLKRRALAVPLFVATLRRAEGVGTALTLAGYDTGPRTRMRRWAWGWPEAVLVAAALLLLATLLPPLQVTLNFLK